MALWAAGGEAVLPFPVPPDTHSCTHIPQQKRSCASTTPRNWYWKKSIKVIELILSWILWSNTLHSQVDTGARQEGVKEVTGCRGRGGEEWNSPFQQQPDLRQIKVTVQPRPLWVAPLISFWACEESAIAPAELRAAQTGFYHPIVLHLLNLWCALPEFLGGSVAIIGKLTKGQYHSSVRRPVCVQLL